MGRPFAVLRTTGSNEIVADVSIATAIPFTRYDVRLIQMPRPSSAPFQARVRAIQTVAPDAGREIGHGPHHPRQGWQVARRVSRAATRGARCGPGWTVGGCRSGCGHHFGDLRWSAVASSGDAPAGVPTPSPSAAQAGKVSEGLPASGRDEGDDHAPPSAGGRSPPRLGGKDNHTVSGPLRLDRCGSVAGAQHGAPTEAEARPRHGRRVSAQRCVGEGWLESVDLCELLGADRAAPQPQDVRVGHHHGRGGRALFQSAMPQVWPHVIGKP